MKPNTKIIDAAYREACKSEHRFRIGAVVYDRSYILGRGYNDGIKTHPASRHPFHTIHAELAAILNATGTTGEHSIYNGVSVYVHRVKKDYSPGLSRPCQWCMKMFSQLRITDIHWSVDEENKP